MSRYNRTLSLDKLLEKEMQIQTDEDIFFDFPHHTPFPRAGMSKQQENNLKFYHSLDSESDSEIPLTYAEKKKKSTAMSPSTGYLDSKKKNYNGSITNLRTLYSHFPLRYCRTIVAHLLLTFIFFLFVFPVVNFFWTYLITQVDHEIDRLLHYIRDDEVNEESLYSHFNRLHWLTVPKFSVETLALILSSILSDVVCLRWLQELEAISLSKIVEKQRVKKYY